MAMNDITREEIMAVYPKVAETMADALGCDVADVKLDVSLIEGLDAESIDFLDMVFRLERAFKIKIPRGKIVENARGTLTEAEFEHKGLVTDVGLAQLKAYLSEVPPERFRTDEIRALRARHRARPGHHALVDAPRPGRSRPSDRLHPLQALCARAGRRRCRRAAHRK